MYNQKKEKVQNELVSVIVPAYNTESYIEKCLYALKTQTYKNIEIIVIDDGSTDGTSKICERYSENDERFIFVKKQNTGVSDTRNLGIHKAHGKYIVFVDSDDFVSASYIETLVHGIERYNVQMACVEYKIVRENDEIDHCKGKNDILMNSMQAIDCLCDSNSFQGYLWNKVFIKDVICRNNISFEQNVAIWEDMLFCLQYLKCISQVVYIPKTVYYYVQRSESAMNDVRIWERHTHVMALENMWTICKDIPGKFRDYIRNFYANELVGMLGKEACCDKAEVCATIKKVEELSGNLSLKHKIKLLIYTFFVNNI